jgi:ATP-dependent Lon protease
LRGQVLPVGGIKEKALAVHRAGAKTFILPRRNESDLDDVPAALKEQVRFVPVDTIDEALEIAMPDEFHMARYGGRERANAAPERLAASSARSPLSRAPDTATGGHSGRPLLCPSTFARTKSKDVVDA